MAIVTLDTNSIVYYLENDPAVISIIEPFLAVQPRPFVATVTELELFSVPSLTSVEAERIEEFLACLA